MARDNDKGLYLPLRVDLDSWEQSLMAADADLKKAMRTMSSEVRDLKMRYSVEIEGAKASGDYLKAIQLRTAQTNQLLEIQTRVVNALSESYAKMGDKSTKAAKDMERELLKQRKTLYQLQQQQSSLGEGIGTKISDALASASPGYAKFRTAIKGVSTEIAGLAAASNTAITALKGFGIVGAGIFAGYKGLQAVTNNVKELAMAASNAAEPVYQLREEIGSSYEDAELLHGVFAIDGGDARQFAASLNQMHRSLKRGNDETNLIAKTLRAYGVELRDVDGKQKSVVEQLRAIADGYQRAKAVGQQRDFLSGIGFSSNQYTHVLEGLDNYIALAKRAQTEDKKQYQALHDLQDAQNMVAEAARNLAVVKGELYAPEHLEVLRAEADAYKGLAKYYKETEGTAKDLVKAQGELAQTFVSINTAVDLMKTKSVGAFAKMLQSARKYLDEFRNSKFGQLYEKVSKLTSFMPISAVSNMVFGADDELKEAERIQNKGRLQSELDKVMQEDAEKKRKAQQEQIAARAKEAEETKKSAELQKKYQDALFEATASDYEKEIKRIQDKKQAFMDEGLSEVEAERLYALQKEQIDKKYYDKRKQEEDNLAKKVEQSYQQQIEAAKRANEAAMGEAETTLRNNLKLVRYMEKVRKQGGDYEAAGRQYAEKLYLKQNGFRQSDISSLKDFGVALVRDIANVRDRLFADFAPNQTVNNTTNNTTVNIDRPVLTDEALVNQLTSKILDKIAPAFKQPDSVNTLA
jgi:hypothetical protein